MAVRFLKIKDIHNKCVKFAAVICAYRVVWNTSGV